MRTPLLLLLVACGGDADPADTGTDPTGFDPCDPAQATSDAVIGETAVSATYPTPAGGTLTDGEYDLARFEIYPPATADSNTRARRLVVQGDQLASIMVDNGAATTIIGGTWSATGSELTIQLDCPNTDMVVVPYTATADEVWLFDPSEPNVQVYQRRP